VSAGGPSNLFLIVGVVINVALTGLAIWWVVRQRVKKAPPEEKPPGDQP